jgi:hypothetical protein
VVSLLLWLDANPRAKGLLTDDLDDASVDAATEGQSALQIACSSRRPRSCGSSTRQLNPDAAGDDLRELMGASGLLTTTPETVAYLVRLAADVK